MSKTARIHIDGKDLLRNGISMNEYNKLTESRKKKKESFGDAISTVDRLIKD